MSIVVHVNRFILQSNREKGRNDPAYCIHVNHEPDFPYLGRFRRLAGAGKWEFEEGRTTPIPEPDTPAGATNVMIVPEDCSIWALEDNGEWKWLGQDYPLLNDIDALPLEAQREWLDRYIDGTFRDEPFAIPIHTHRHSHGLRWEGRSWEGFYHTHPHEHIDYVPPRPKWRVSLVPENIVDIYNHIDGDFHYVGHAGHDEETTTPMNETQREQRARFEAAFTSAREQTDKLNEIDWFSDNNAFYSVAETLEVDFDDDDYSDDSYDVNPRTLDTAVKDGARLLKDAEDALTQAQNNVASAAALLNCVTSARDLYVERPDEDEAVAVDERRGDGGIFINGEFVETSAGN